MRWCSCILHTVIHGKSLLAEQTLTWSTSVQIVTVYSLNGGMELLGKFIYFHRLFVNRISLPMFPWRGSEETYDL